MKCLQQIHDIHWYQHVSSSMSYIVILFKLRSYKIADHIAQQHSATFSHIAWTLDDADDVLAHRG